MSTRRGAAAVGDYVPASAIADAVAPAMPVCWHCGEIIPPGYQHIGVTGYGDDPVSCVPAPAGPGRRR